MDTVKDTEMRARIIGDAAQMKEFDYYFGVSLEELILRHSDHLIKPYSAKSGYICSRRSRGRYYDK